MVTGHGGYKRGPKSRMPVIPSILDPRQASQIFISIPTRFLLYLFLLEIFKMLRLWSEDMDWLSVEGPESGYSSRAPTPSPEVESRLFHFGPVAQTHSGYHEEAKHYEDSEVVHKLLEIRKPEYEFESSEATPESFGRLEPHGDFVVTEEQYEDSGAIQEPPRNSGVTEEQYKDWGVIEQPHGDFVVTEEQYEDWGAIEQPHGDSAVTEEQYEDWGAIEQPHGHFGVTQKQYEDLGFAEEAHEDYRAMEVHHEDFGVLEEPHEDLNVIEKPFGDFGAIEKPVVDIGAIEKPLRWLEPYGLGGGFVMDPKGLQGPVILEPVGRVHQGEMTTFLIQLGPHGTLDLSTLEVFVVGPSGTRYPIILTYAPTLNQHCCTFRPLEIGLHVGVVQYGRCHLPGSPIHTFVHRNYSAIQGPVLTFDLELEPYLRACARKPWGIACNINTEQILVTDREQHEVLVYGAEGDLLYTFGGPGKGLGQFKRPTGIAFDSHRSRIFVTDKDNHRVQIFTVRGKFISSFGGRGRKDGNFYYPWGVAVSYCGTRVAVADSRNHRVQLFTSNGIFLRSFAGRAFGFDYPRGVAFNSTGETIFVTDFNLHTVFRIDIGLNSCQAIVQNLQRPSGIDVDASGSLLVTDSRSHALRVFSPTGQYLHELSRFGVASSSKNRLDLPTDVACMKAGFFAIMDLNGRVRIL